MGIEMRTLRALATLGSENGFIGLLSIDSASHRFLLRLRSRSHPRCLSSCPALATIGRVATLAIGSGGDKMNEIHGKHHFWSTCWAHAPTSHVNDHVIRPNFAIRALRY